ncbi:MAG: phage tail tip lysozyme, partial [Bacillota bacterium]|nr:phage tail tip lysozyme [Bacillota bacterium]
MKIRITSIVLSILVLFAFVPQISFGTVEEEGTITGFVEMNNSSFYFEGDPDEDELTAGLPDAIGVYLDGSQEPELIPVTWESVEDYDNSNFYFYSLKPVWEGYTLSEDLNEIFDVPWITVYKQEPENDSIEPMYSEEDIDPIYTEEEGSNDVGDEVYDDSIDLSLLDGTSLLDAFAEESYAATSTTEVVYNFLTKDMGLNMAAACAVMTNIYAESAMSSINLQNTYNRSLNLSDTEYTRLVDKSSDGKYKSGKNFKTDEAGYGLCQWTSSGRKTSLFNRSKESKTSIGDTKMQLNQLKSELTSSYPQVYNTLKKVPNTAEGAYLASAIFCINFEIPANTINTAASRGKTCMNGYWKTYSKKSGDVSGRSYTGICGYTYPTAVKKSKGMDAKGYVISNGKIKTVEAKITDSKGKVVYSKKASPGTTAYSLYKMDSALKFSSLDVGKY